jgi:PAS domain-containing protein
MEHYLSERVAGISYVTALMLFDADGKLLNSSRSWPVPEVDSTEPDYVRAQMATWLPQPFLSGPALSKTTGKWTMFISRRFNGLDGRLAGILVGAIALDYFEQFYSRLPLTGGGSFVLYRRDGTLMARYPQVEGKVGQNYRAAVNFKLLVAALDAGSVRLVSTLDGRDRVMAPRTMEHFPLIVAVSDTVDSIFTAWNEQARVFAITTVLLELVLGATVLVSLRHMVGYERLQQAETKLAVAQERERADEAVHRQEHRLDMALHNMLQGLLMISHSGELLMVNRRFYQMFGMPVGSLALGIDYATLTHKIVELGNVSKDDMRGIRDLRSELLARNARAVST